VFACQQSEALMKIIDCPALTHRSGDYPSRFNGAVPWIIEAAEDVQSEVYQFTLSPLDASLRVIRGQQYPSWTNSHGAVCAVLPDGRKLGLKPHEFRVVRWYAINTCPGCNLPTGEGANFCASCGKEIAEQIELGQQRLIEATERMRRENDEWVERQVGKR
jgi:hypothetical protein